MGALESYHIRFGTTSTTTGYLGPDRGIRKIASKLSVTLEGFFEVAVYSRY